MKAYLKLSLVVGALALIVPAMALATPGNGQGKGQSQSPEYTPAPSPPPKGQAPNGQAYGKYCQGESKKHAKGEKGTAFSRCVKATAKLRHDERKKAKEEQHA
jgi:hypothetical protein